MVSSGPCWRRPPPDGGRRIQRNVYPRRNNDVGKHLVGSVPFSLDQIGANEVAVRGICHDEKVYPDPETFNPDRFLGKDGKIDPSVKDPEVRIFGSGRRWVCRLVCYYAVVNIDDLGFAPGDISHFETCIW